MRRLGLRIPASKEEKVAVAIGKLLSDYLVYSRSIELLEATKYNKEVAEYNQIGKYYGQGTLF